MVAKSSSGETTVPLIFGELFLRHDFGVEGQVFDIALTNPAQREAAKMALTQAGVVVDHASYLPRIVGDLTIEVVGPAEWEAVAVSGLALTPIEFPPTK